MTSPDEILAGSKLILTVVRLVLGSEETNVAVGEDGPVKGSPVAP
jgi:hypothetical protein